MAARDGLADAVSGRVGRNKGGGSGIWGILLVVVLLAVAALVIVIVVRSRPESPRHRRRFGRRGDGPGRAHGPARGGVDEEELGRRAASALVATDDAIKTSEQELEFARAQFGDAAAAEFQTALARAKEDLDRAFALKRQLDDRTPDAEADTRAWNAQIIDLCTHANGKLDEKAKAFDELRQLEQNAPEALARIRAEHDAVTARQEAATSSLAMAQRAYAAEALATIADDPAQAAERLTFAQEHLAAAEREINAGDGASAAVEIRSAEAAVGRPISCRRRSTSSAPTSPAARRTLRRSSPTSSRTSPPRRPSPITPTGDSRRSSRLRQQVDAAKALLTGSAKRPLFALEGLQKANAQIDAALAGVRDAQAQAQRQVARLNLALNQAQGQVSAAEDYITSRRGVRRCAGAHASPRPARRSCRPVSCSRAIPPRPCSSRRGRTISPHRRSSWRRTMSRLLRGSLRRGRRGRQRHGSRARRHPHQLASQRRPGSRGGGGFGGGFGGGGRSSGGGMSPSGFGGGGTRSRRGGGHSDRPHPDLSTTHIVTRKGKPMAKQSIFGRISTLVKANINAMLDSAEDPQKMLDQLVRDYTNNIADAESAIAETIGNLRLLERDYEEDVKAAAEWGNKALAASRKADEARCRQHDGCRQVRQPRQDRGAAPQRGERGRGRSRRRSRRRPKSSTSSRTASTA